MKATSSAFPTNFEKIRDQIKTHLEERKTAARKKSISELSDETQMLVYFKASRTLLSSNGDECSPVKDAEKTAGSIVTFANFESRFCKRLQSTLNEALSIISTMES